MSNIVEAPKEFDPNATVPAIPKEEIPESMRGKALTADDLANLAELIKKNISGKEPQLVAKKNVFVTDFSNLTQDDIYNSAIPIEARPFMMGDPLKVKLKDTNYEARWVNKKSERLGYMKAIGFTYVIAADIEGDLEIDIETDSNGHYSFHDVVLMRVPKQKYFAALKAANERAKTVVSNKKAANNGQAVANNFMQNSGFGSDYAEASEESKLTFYQPNA